MVAYKHEWLNNLITKLNNIEANGVKPERTYYLGKKLWFIGNNLLCDGELATLRQINEFQKLYEDFNK